MQLLASFINTFTDPEIVFNELKKKNNWQTCTMPLVVLMVVGSISLAVLKDLYYDVQLEQSIEWIENSSQIPAENLVVIVSGSNIAGDLEYNIVSVQNGDVNLDGQINIQDVIISVNITLGIYEPSTEQFEMADINNDGIVNVLDIIQLVNIILGN